ncbi:hypothetical protein CYMTET_14453 [Cymbomonas tetramitiformis]|uniref:Cation/H+ exchanger domain-containing protein n=1 Tax=Cymbomonas tetramitiformis TaxID=36881 RepID=A0AAE0LAC6_9CHLO|nr:hypothetical protein CYMTET_14453 [Cymbomonas tetramitiformis]
MPRERWHGARSAIGLIWVTASSRRACAAGEDRPTSKRTFHNNAGGAMLILAASFVGKMMIIPVGMMLGLSWIESAIQAALLNCRGLLVLVVNLAAADQNLYGEAMVNSMVVMALASTIVTIPLVDKLMELKVKADVKQPCVDGSDNIDPRTVTHPSKVKLEDAHAPDVSVEEGCVQLAPLSQKTLSLTHDSSSSAI